MNTKETLEKLKKFGLSAVNSAKEGLNEVKETAQFAILDEQLRYRFNLQNPYKFVVHPEGKKINLLDEVGSRHAKKYDEDDLFVFYGSADRNHFHIGDHVTELSSNFIYVIESIVDVTVPVELNDKSYDCDATAVMCKPL